MIRRIIYAVIILAFGLVCFKLGQRSVKFSAYLEAREAADNKAVFDENFRAMSEWVANYKREHPNASEQQIQDAYAKALGVQN